MKLIKLNQIFAVKCVAMVREGKAIVSMMTSFVNKKGRLLQGERLTVRSNLLMLLFWQIYYSLCSGNLVWLNVVLVQRTVELYSNDR